ncbi:ATP-binding domain-containing protein [Tolypothrix sp. VBCCA 56010]|uniref:ATP-binding domain-containing protein n=1 Tax=Tolypothrix sp. VBCCA 56010 TaxID=3137731 RepID=UPI003D7ECF07
MSVKRINLSATGIICDRAVAKEGEARSTKHLPPPCKRRGGDSKNKNCRNTQKIHEYVLKFHPESNSTSSLCPLGQDVEIHSYTDDTQLKNTLGRLLHRLVINEAFTTKDIVILTTTRRQSLQNQVVGKFRIKATPDINGPEILCNTIHHFKGLESKVVILIETESNPPNHKQLLYVGASRARHHLIILRPNASVNRR